jgi:hypothetical protein
MAVTNRTLNELLTIMRRAIGRKNVNDPDATTTILTQYVNDFYSLTMSDDIRLFENYGTLEFTIDENGANGTDNTGIYTFNDVGASSDFVSLSLMAFISLEDPVNNSVSWNQLPIYLDPGEFYSIWGINNYEILIAGYPTNLLFYGNELVFRTVPDTSYQVQIYGYKMRDDFPVDVDDDIPFARWMRYIAYGAAKNYAQDFRFAPEDIALIDKGYSREKKLMLTHAHNQQKLSRSMPRF